MNQAEGLRPGGVEHWQYEGCGSLDQGSASQAKVRQCHGPLIAIPYRSFKRPREMELCAVDLAQVQQALGNVRIDVVVLHHGVGAFGVGRQPLCTAR